MGNTDIKTLGIVVDDGYRRVPIYNSDGEENGYFRFNPTDVNIINRYNKMVKDFDSIVEPLQGVPDGPEGESEELDGLRIQAMETAKERLYDAINMLFDADAAGAFFGKIHPFSPVDGRMYCEVVLEAVGKYISEQFEQETAKMERRISKYTKKYARKK